MGNIKAICVVHDSDARRYAIQLMEQVERMQEQDLVVEIIPVSNNYQHYALVVGRE